MENEKIFLKREEKKKRLLEMLHKKRESRISDISRKKSPLRAESHVQVPYIKRDRKPKEADRSYQAMGKRRKKRRERLAEIFSKGFEKDGKAKIARTDGDNHLREERLKKREEELAWKKARAEEAVIEKRRKVEEERKKAESARAEAARQKEEKARQLQEAARKEKEALLARKAEAIRLKEEERKKAEFARAEAARQKEEKAHQLQEAARKEKEALLARKTEVLRLKEEERKKAESARAEAAGQKEEKARQLQEAARKEKEALLARKAEAIRLKEEERKKAESARAEATRKEKEILLARKAEALRLKEEERKKTESARAEKMIALPVLRGRERDRVGLISAVLKEKQSARKKVKTPQSVPVVEEIKRGYPKVAAAQSAEDRESAARIKTHILTLQKESDRINSLSAPQVRESVQSLHKFAAALRKKKVVSVPVKDAKARRIVEQHREPFQILPFIRKNAFKLVSLLLLLVWAAELFLFYIGLKDASARLKSIVGEDPYTGMGGGPVEEPAPVGAETEEAPDAGVEIAAREKIDIEGKRDPFSPGKLTMEVLERPTPTSIVLASKPEVISILRTPKKVSILREEKLMEPERVSAPVKSQKPSVAPVSVTALPEIPRPIKARPLEKASVPEVTPLIMPEMRCDLVYRGRMIFEGVEYLFIEGKQKTYRVTIGDIVEGFRILRRDRDKLYLSKDGVTFEIKID